jgi:MOSC domain-containing protein YiiM
MKVDPLIGDDMSAAQLIGIARRDARRAPMEELDAGSISRERGLEGDVKGAKFPRRQITILAEEDWLAAIGELTDLAGAVPLPWTARRANLLVRGVELPRAKGSLIAVGAVELEVTGQTVPCARMDEAHAGLRRALHPAWRGGVTCRVTKSGDIRVGDPVHVLFAAEQRHINLPG